ncbi:unnamed protein product [Rhizophagus irregularis]|nr:unnamed protein product [Rhizophagus irregularis]
MKETPLPFWGETTATLDWCEENYIVHKYIAEFINTTTKSYFYHFGQFSGIYTTFKCDELPMIYAACVLTHDMFRNRRKKKVRLIFTISLIYICTKCNSGLFIYQQSSISSISYALLLAHQLIAARRRIGMPLSHLLELHGWWHMALRLVCSYVAKISTTSKKEIKLNSKVE